MNSNHKKVVIVTGAARGIGLATSKLFLKNNYKVAMVDRDIKELQKIKIDGLIIRHLIVKYKNLDTKNEYFKKEN